MQETLPTKTLPVLLVKKRSYFTAEEIPGSLIDPVEQLIMQRYVLYRRQEWRTVFCLPGELVVLLEHEMHNKVLGVKVLHPEHGVIFSTFDTDYSSFSEFFDVLTGEEQSC